MGSENSCVFGAEKHLWQSNRTWVVSILRDSVVARVLCCRDAQVRTSLARLEHLGGCGHVHLCASESQPSSQFKNVSSKTSSKQKTTAVLSPRSKVARPPVLSPVRNKFRSLSSATFQSIVEVTVEEQRSAPGTAALEIRCTRRTCHNIVTQVL